MIISPYSSVLAFAFSSATLAWVGVGWSHATEPAGSLPPAAKLQAEAPKPPVPAAAIMEPEELARVLASPAHDKPLVLQVGFRFLYKEAHIPGAEYIGPASKEDGIRQLRQRVASLPRTRPIVIYCGCCPWIRCPNVKPAYDALRELGFKQVKVLRIDDNFGANWVAKGYPTAKGE